MSDVSTSTNSSQGSSSSSPVQTPENDISNAVSATASSMASQLYSWAQGVYAQTSAVTNEAVGNFFTASKQMMGLSNSMIDQYNSLFAPENAELVADANSYASPARIDADMGMAGATQAQAGASAEQNSISQLQQFGIDPSSGRYSSLLNADNVQNAANVAGAENTQQRADVATGQQLRADAVQVGAQLPSSIANVTNTSLQALNGAENAELGNANTGNSLMNTPNNYLKTAGNILQPMQASKSQNTSQGNSNSTKTDAGKSQPNPSGQGNGGGQGNAGGQAWGMNMPAGGPTLTPVNQNQNQNQDNGDYNLGDMYGPDSIGGVLPEDFTGGDGSMTIGQPGSADTPIQNTDSNQNGGISDPFQNGGFGDTLPQDNSGFGGQNQTFTGSNGAQDTPYGNINYNSSANGANGNAEGGGGGSWGDGSAFGTPGSFGDTTGSLGGSDSGTFGNAPTPPPSQDSGQSPYAGGDMGDTGDSTYTPPSSTGDSSESWTPNDDTDTSTTSPEDQAQDDAQDSGDDSGGDYARGGPVMGIPRHVIPHRNNHMRKHGQRRLQMASGGQVPAAASPSRGAVTDDIPAHVNANEFVIPQDVALWKGQEFFQNLITQSRQKRMMAPAAAQKAPKAQPTAGAR